MDDGWITNLQINAKYLNKSSFKSGFSGDITRQMKSKYLTPNIEIHPTAD